MSYYHPACFPLKSGILVSGACKKERWGGCGKEKAQTGPGASVPGVGQPSLGPGTGLSEPLGSEVRLLRALLEPASQREALQEEQGTTANSKLFALHEHPADQAPFLVNILDGRPKNNNVFP